MRVKVICCVLVLLVSQVAFAGENLIKNGGFEDEALPWGFHPAEERVITLDNADFYSGRYSLRFEHKSGESYSRIIHNYRYGQVLISPWFFQGTAYLDNLVLTKVAPGDPIQVEVGAIEKREGDR